MSTQWLMTSAVWGLAGLAPVLVLVALLRRLGTLNAAGWLVMWGAFLVAGEHAGSRSSTRSRCRALRWSRRAGLPRTCTRAYTA
jgi:hypothetical protein